MADEKDIAPELYERLLNDFDRSIADDPEITELLEKIKAGKATYAEANEFAIRVGELLAKDFGENITMEMLPDGKMYYNIANRTVRPMLEQGHGLIADICETVQGNMNQKAGLGIKPIRPTRNDDRIHSIVNGVTSKEKYSDAARILDAPVINCMQSVVDDSIKANVDFQGKAGLYPRIKREAVGGCCQWCLDQAGTYRYPDVPKDVYRRHDNCRCTVDYDPASGLMRGKTQNVHTKKWETPEEREARLARREITGLDLSSSRDKIEQRKLIRLGNEYTRRKIGSQGQEIIDKATYNKVTKDFVKNHGIIIRGQEAAKHLDGQSAYASYITGANIAFIRDDATVSDVLEEMYHAKQDRMGMFSELSFDDMVIKREIDAQEYLLSVTDKYKIPKNEVETTKSNLEHYLKLLADKRNGG